MQIDHALEKRLADLAESKRRLVEKKQALVTEIDQELAEIEALEKSKTVLRGKRGR